MKIYLKARPYKTIHGKVFLLSNMVLLKPKKVDEIFIVPNGVMDALSNDSYKFLYDDKFMEMFRDLDDFSLVKAVILKLKGGELEKELRVEIDKVKSNYTLGSYPNSIYTYIEEYLPNDYEVTFTNESQIIIKNLVRQTTPGKKGFELFVNTDGQEFFRFPKEICRDIIKI